MSYPDDDMPFEFFADASARALSWARDLVAANNFVVLDTETTGLDDQAQIVDIAVIDSSGAILLDTLIRPTRVISRAAGSIHKITHEMVAAAPTFDDAYPQLVAAVSGKTVVIYNADFDLRLMEQSLLDRAIFSNFCEAVSDVNCAMLPFSEFYGDWSDWHGSFTWKSLSTACDYFGLPAPNHRALGDCIATLAVVKAMAAHE